MLNELLEIRNTANKLSESASPELINITNNIGDAITDIKNNTLKIGYNLAILRNTKAYESGGYESEIEYGEAVFGFKKSAIYNFIKMADIFLDGNGNFIDSRYEEYSPSQLRAIASLPVDKIGQLINDGKIRPSMTFKAISEIAKTEKGKGKSEKKEKTDSQKKSAKVTDIDFYTLKIGVNSMGNPYIKYMDTSPNSEDTTEKIASKINTKYLDEIITSITIVLNEQSNIIMTENEKYLLNIERFKEAAKEMTDEEILSYALEMREDQD